MKTSIFCQKLRNELILLGYSFKALKCHNLLAITGLLAIMVIDALCGELGLRETKELLQYKALELYAPMIGILLFSDLIAQEFETRRGDLLRSCAMGFTAVILRKLAHGLIFLSITFLFALLIWRVCFARADVFFALGVALPGAVYFGMIGLFAATLSQKSITGYLAGFTALAVSYLGNVCAPLEFLTFAVKKQYDNLRFFEDANWLIAKFFFVVMALVLIHLIILTVRRPQLLRKVGLGTPVVLIVVYGILNAVWESEPKTHPRYASPALLLDVRQNEDSLVITTAQHVQDWENTRRKDSTEFKAHEYRLANGIWSKRQESPYPGPTASLKLQNISVEARIEPSDKTIDATATLSSLINTDKTDTLCFHLPWEFTVASVKVNDKQADFSKYSDLVVVKPGQYFVEDESVQIEVCYNGVFVPFKKRDEIFRAEYIKTNRWLPYLWMNYNEDFSLNATVWLPANFQAVSKEIIEEDAGYKAHRIELPHCNNYHTSLYAGKFHRYEDKTGKVPISVFSFSNNAQQARQIIQRCRSSIEYFESVYAPFPYTYLAVADDPYQQSGGMASPALIKMQSVQWAPENRHQFLNVYIPHEVAHQWWGGGYPKWVCEGLAVMSNVAFLDHENNELGKHMILSDLNHFFERGKFMGPTQPLQSDRNPYTFYTRAFYLFNTLYQELGAKQFMQMLSSYYLQTAFGHDFAQEACAEKLISIINNQCKPSLQNFVKIWIETNQTFDPELTALHVDKIDSKYRVTAQLQHNGEIRQPVVIRFTMRDGSKRDIKWNAHEETLQASWNFEQSVVSAQLNPDLECLDWNRSNNSAKVAPKSRADALVSPAVEKRPSGWQTYTSAHGLPSEDVRCLIVDQKARVHAGFENCRSSKSMLAYSHNQPLPDATWCAPEDIPRISKIYAIAEGPEHDMWLFGAKAQEQNANRLFHLSPTGVKEWTLKEVPLVQQPYIGVDSKFKSNPNSNSNIAGYHVYTILPISATQVWLGTDHGITKFDPTTGQTAHFTQENSELPGNDVFSMMCDSQGAIWAGTNRGVAVFETNDWQAKPELGKDMIIAMTADQNGNRWFGAYRRGLIQQTRDQIILHTPNNSALRHTMILSLAAAPSGIIWVGTPEGLSCFNGSESYSLTTKNSGLPSNQIKALAVEQNRLWIGTDRGISRFELAERPEKQYALLETK
jgi:hypothetical protein